MQEIPGAMMPNNDALLTEIREIRRAADLMSVTKKSIEVELDKRFGVKLEGRKAYIGSGEFFFHCVLKHLCVRERGIDIANVTGFF